MENRTLQSRSLEVNHPSTSEVWSFYQSPRLSILPWESSDSKIFSPYFLPSCIDHPVSNLVVLGNAQNSLILDILVGLSVSQYIASCTECGCLVFLRNKRGYTVCYVVCVMKTR